MQGRSGVSATSAENLILDAGHAYANIDLTALESTDVATALTAGVSLGATRGGSSFAPGRTLRQIPADGLLGPTKGFIRRQTVAPVLTVNLLEMTPENLIKMIAGASGADTGALTDDTQKITGGPIEAADYLDNVAIVATYSGTTVPVIIVVKNAIVLEAPNLATADEDETVTAVPFAGTFDPADLTDEPWAIYHPTTIV